jgi:ABC-type Zn2+ transport system substrate-binding protein/surface adhesin
MKTERVGGQAPATGHVHTGAPGHAHGHGHDHSHDHAHAAPHRHAPGHDHGAHARDVSLSLATAARPPVASLLMSSALRRLVGAIGLIALLWAAVAWALSGTP